MIDAPRAASGRVVVVRHGATEWTELGKHTGAADIPLSDAGRRQSARLADVLAAEHFDRVFCSPMLRALETCELVGFGARSEIVNELHEWNYGEYEGLTSAEVLARRPDWNLWSDGCPGGEMPAEVGARADRALAVLTSSAAGEGAVNVIAFAHGHLLRVLASRWVGLEAANGRVLAMSPAGVGVLSFEHAKPVIERWNAPAP